MLKKKTRFVLGIAFALMGIFANYRSAASERGKVLQAKLSGADSILLSDLDFRIIEEAKKPKRISGSEEISQLIALLEFNDGKSGFHCMCAGDTKLEFYRGKQLLATISHHHGQSLRWHGGEWEGDSLFSKEAAKAWREWFGANDEPRFLEMHQEIVAEAERKAEIQRRFFSRLPAGAEEIFLSARNQGWVTASPPKKEDDTKKKLSLPAQRIEALFDSRIELGKAVSAALGSLAESGAGLGSWSASSPREQLALEVAGTLSGVDFQSVLESTDTLVLLGAARLFFFERMAERISESQRGGYAAKLCHIVVEHDKSDNAVSAIRRLRSYPESEECHSLLEEVAMGKVAAQFERSHYDNEPGAQTAACVVLAELGNRRGGEIARSLKGKNDLTQYDQAALEVARTLSGERDILSKDVFELNSYIIGYGALMALENERSKKALDLVISGGTRHSWAAVREEAVLTAERLSGKRWSSKDTRGRAELHAEEVRQWWEANRETFEFPEEQDQE